VGDIRAGRVIGPPWPRCSAGNGPRPSGPDRECWVQARHNRPEWLGHREGAGVLRQYQDSTKTALTLLSLVLSWHCLGVAQAMAGAGVSPSN
jgi:hypothetical protein